MKATYFLLLCILSTFDMLVAMDSPHIICAEKGTLFGDMQKGPMNPDWFYSGVLPYRKANQLHQLRQWKEAAQEYRNIKNETLMQYIEHDKSQAIIYRPTLEEIVYAQHMCRLNEAICSMAQGQADKGWISFDNLINISPRRRICLEEGEKYTQLRGALVKVRTDHIGIGDIPHFMMAAVRLKNDKRCFIAFCVRDFLKDALSGFATAYDLQICGEGKNEPETQYETHLVSLLGHLQLKPQEIIPPRVVLTTSDKAMVEVDQQIQPFLAQGKKIAAVFLGENRQATLIGGKQLPYDKSKHGRHLDSKPFEQLLRKHFNLILLDCGTKDSQVTVDADQQKKCFHLVPEEQRFDTIIALAWLMNIHQNIISFGADNGPFNLFTRALDKQAQKRAAFIIPNGSKDHGEYDMRMEGPGQQYKHMLYDNCMVYKCENRAQQTEVIAIAYDDMIESDMHQNTYSFTMKNGDLKPVTLHEQ